MSKKVADSIKRGLEQAVDHAQQAQAPDPGTRGLTVSTCDMRHQAIAFAGTCPLCRFKLGAESAQGHMIYGADLERLLRAHYAAGGAGARQG